MQPTQPDNREAAETIALQALGFLASDADRLSRFLALTGIGPAELRARAGEPAFLSGVLDHLLRDETLLLVFATEAAVPPATVAAAHEMLIGGLQPTTAKRSAKIVPIRRT